MPSWLIIVLFILGGTLLYAGVKDCELLSVIQGNPVHPDGSPCAKLRGQPQPKRKAPRSAGPGRQFK